MSDLTAMQWARLALSEPDTEDGTACRKCGDFYGVRDGCEPSALCDPCAQEGVGALARAVQVLHAKCKSLKPRKAVTATAKRTGG